MTRIDLAHRQHVIAQLLERHAEFTDPIQAGNGLGDTGVLLMPHDKTCAIRRELPDRDPHPTDPRILRCSCSRRSILELERLLAAMRDDRLRPLERWTTGNGTPHIASVRQLWWNVTERYLRGTVTIKEIRVQRRGKNGKKFTEVERQLVPSYQAGVDPIRVERAIVWLAANWAAPEPELPMAAVLKPGDKQRPEPARAA